MKGAVIFLAIVAILALTAVALSWIDSRMKGARKDRTERARHEDFLNDLLVECIDARDVDLFAASTADKIRNHLTNKTRRKGVRS